VQTGEPQSMTLDLETGVLVSGHILDAEGNPVAGAGFSAIADSQNGPDLGGDLTDAKGRYQFRIPAGKARLYFNSLPDGFVYPDPQIVEALDIEPGQADIQTWTLPSGENQTEAGDRLSAAQVVATPRETA